MNARINALRLLEELKQTSQREKRSSTRFLKDPEAELTSEWAFSLNKAFNDALDIKRTDRIVNGEKQKVWTQGSRFAFDVGDVFKSGPICLQVDDSDNAMPGTQTESRYSGEVTLRVFIENQNGSGMRYCGQAYISQDALVGYLVSGENPRIDSVLREAAKQGAY